MNPQNVRMTQTVSLNTFNLQRLMECPVCLEVFTRPKVFPTCQHTFCLTCLYRLYVAHVQDGRNEFMLRLCNNCHGYLGGCPDVIICAVCKQPFPLFTKLFAMHMFGLKRKHFYAVMLFPSLAAFQYITDADNAHCCESRRWEIVRYLQRQWSL